MLQSQLLILLLSAVLAVHGQLNLFDELYAEDDFVDVDFNGCEHCEHNYRNMVFILKNSEEPSVLSTYFIVLLIMWLCLGALVAIQRWRKLH
ncbi:hypothetical protein KR093_008018 [Drosophila rubida]|uniref:Uncharacterized protein n=1 Tax=Drosophila rubida TaxID=30044 RepID=A0AAD4PP63_9MUSC|nr:hypothetical protein KR093_008018 [Drosophila rubida]